MKNKTLILSIIGAVILIGSAYFVTTKDSAQTSNTVMKGSSNSTQGMDPNMPGMDMSGVSR